MNDLSRALRALPFALAALAALLAASVPALAEEAMIPGFGPPLDAGAAVVPARPARTTLTSAGTCGLGFRSTIPAKGVQLWYVRNVLRVYNVTWLVMPGTTSPGPSVSLATVAMQQTDSAHATYWLGVDNYASTAQTFEMRYCVL